MYCAVLFLFLAPDIVIWLFNTSGNDSSSFAYTRAGMLFLGLGVIAWCSRESSNSEAHHEDGIGFFTVIDTIINISIIAKKVKPRQS